MTALKKVREEMDNIIEFKIGCHKCKHSRMISAGTYVCDAISFEDGSEVYPKVNGRHKDWDACEGKYYEHEDDEDDVRIERKEDLCQKKSCQ